MRTVHRFIWALAVVAGGLGCDDGGSAIDGSVGDASEPADLGGVGGDGDGLGGEFGFGGAFGGADGEGGADGGPDDNDGGVRPCTPQCDGRVCGSDGCGGECGPGCGAGEACDDGACVLDECPAGTTWCDGVCVDLTNDADHCGGCGQRCIDTWPEELDEQGIRFEDVNMQAVCERASCAFTCDAPDIEPDDLVEDLLHCGACGNRCENDAINSTGDLCRGGECLCTLQASGNQVVGRVCDGWCQMRLTGGGNCADDCCPTIAARNPIVPDQFNQFVFALDSPVALTIGAECEAGRGSVRQYRLDGELETLNFVDCGQALELPIVGAGRYAALLRSEGTPGALTYAERPIVVDFDVPGEFTRAASGDRLNYVVRVAEAGEYAFEIVGAEDSTCDRFMTITVRDGTGALVEVVEHALACSPTLRHAWTNRLAPGTYALSVFEQRPRPNERLPGHLRGDHRLVIQRR